MAWDWKKIAAAAGIIGGIVGAVLPADWMGNVFTYGDTASGILSGVAGALAAFLLAARAAKKLPQ